MIIATSGRPPKRQAKASATSPPNAPETVVLTMMVGTSGVSPRVLPPLKPNQPNHSKNTPERHHGQVVAVNWNGVFAEAADTRARG